jgi:hypothetical protein
MQVYMRGNEPLHLDPSNLMAMRADLYSKHFEPGTFAIVPKCGELRIHFLKRVQNAGNYYHNTLFDNSHVARQLLFARFALQVINSSRSNVFGHDGGGTAGVGGGDHEIGRKYSRKRLRDESDTGNRIKKIKTKGKGREDTVPEKNTEEEMDADSERGSY